MLFKRRKTNNYFNNKRKPKAKTQVDKKQDKQIKKLIIQNKPETKVIFDLVPATGTLQQLTNASQVLDISVTDQGNDAVGNYAGAFTVREGNSIRCMGYDYVFDISYSQAGPSFYRIIVARLKSNYVTTGSITGSQVLQSYDVTNNSFNNFNSPPNIFS